MIDLINLASGSRGNCTLITTADTNVLVDAGISANQIVKRLPVDPQKINAVFITHEHTDHVLGIADFAGKYGVPVFVHEKVCHTVIQHSGLDAKYVDTFGDLPFEFRDMTVNAFRIPHDTVYPVGFVFSKGDCKTGVVTDLGTVNPGVYNNIKDCDTILLESNHDEQMLRTGKYPPLLKRRILGDNGHISNETCADTLLKMSAIRLKRAMLGHISENNNTPRLAYSTSEKILLMNGIVVGKDVQLAVSSPNTITRFR